MPAVNSQLTNREREVLYLLASGRTDRKIAHREDAPLDDAVALRRATRAEHHARLIGRQRAIRADHNSPEDVVARGPNARREDSDTAGTHPKYLPENVGGNADCLST